MNTSTRVQTDEDIAKGALRERERVELNRRAGYGEQVPFPSFRRIVRPGAIPMYTGRLDGRAPLYVTIEWRDGQLSLTGVEGPKSNGDAWGGCGQCGVAADIEPYTANGWTAEMCARLGEVWERWHMNDIRAGCAHVEPGVSSVKLELRPLTWGDTYHERRRLVESAKATAQEYAEFCEWSGIVTRLCASKGPKHPALWGEVGENALRDGLVKEPGADSVTRYERTKAAGWVYPSEHPDGLLTRPCAVCGVKYGAQWLSEPVPVDVLEWLRGLPTEGAEAIPACWAR